MRVFSAKALECVWNVSHLCNVAPRYFIVHFSMEYENLARRQKPLTSTPCKKGCMGLGSIKFNLSFGAIIFDNLKQSGNYYSLTQPCIFMN